MRINTLELEDFRNYKHETVALVAGVNLIVGRNAQGKTNLLEAVCCIGGLGSPRGQDSSLVRHGAERALLHAELVRRGRNHRVDLEIRTTRGTKALIDKNRAPAAGALTELAPTVFFGPDELALVKGSPEGRRRFVDDLVVKLRPGRAEARRDFDRALKQRNALLKSIPRGGGWSLATLDVWDETFARAGASLVEMRMESLQGLRPLALSRYESIAGGGELDLTYSSSWLPPDGHKDADVLYEALRAMLERNRRREVERGLSIEGPQRDDLVVKVGQGGDLFDARAFASQGDQRTIALALKLAEHDLVTAALGEPPALLLDDVFSELDEKRRRWLADTVGEIEQVLISAADPGVGDAVPAAVVYEVETGRAHRRG